MAMCLGAHPEGSLGRGESPPPLSEALEVVSGSIVACFRDCVLDGISRLEVWRGSEARADGWRVRRTLLQTHTSRLSLPFPHSRPPRPAATRTKPPRANTAGAANSRRACAKSTRACASTNGPLVGPSESRPHQKKKEERKHPHYSEIATRKRITHDEGFSEAKGAVSRSWASS